MAEYTSTRNNLELTDIYVDTDNDGIYESLVLQTGATIPVGAIDNDILQKSINSGSIARAVAQGWLTVLATTVQTVTSTLPNGLVMAMSGDWVRYFNTSATTTASITIV